MLTTTSALQRHIGIMPMMLFSKTDLLVDTITTAVRRRATREDYEQKAWRTRTILDERDGLLQLRAKLQGTTQEFNLPEPLNEPNPISYLFQSSGLDGLETRIAELTLQGLTDQEISNSRDFRLTSRSVCQYSYLIAGKIRKFLEDNSCSLPTAGTSIINLVYFWLHTYVGSDAKELVELGKLFRLAELSQGERVQAYLRVMGFTNKEITKLLSTSEGMVRIVVGQPLPLKFQLLLPADDSQYPHMDGQRTIELDQLIVRVLHKQ